MYRLRVAKKRRREVVDTDGVELKHNPFAALGGRIESEAEPTPQRREAAASKPLHLEGKIVVRREKKGRGGKTITRITGLRAGDCDEVASLMKKALGCGATVEDDEVVLLGALVDRAADWLQARGAGNVVTGN